MKKRGQLTLFIIVGIVVLFAVGIVLYLASTTEVKRFEQARLAAERAPFQFRPVVEFIGDCVRATAEDGLRRIGDTGGYVGKLSYNPVEPTEGSAVQFAPDSELVTAYWWHLESKNDCTADCRFASKRPNLYKAGGEPSIQGQLENYISANLEQCLAGFRTFREQGFSFETPAQPKAEVTIADRVKVLVSYPVTMRQASSEFSISEHYAEIDLNLKRIYEVATEIVNLEMNKSFLEMSARQLIDIFSRTDKEALPPVSELVVSTDYGPFWLKQDVENRFRQILAAYTPLLQVLGSLNHRPIIAPAGTRDPELHKTIYNRGFLVPLYTDEIGSKKNALQSAVSLAQKKGLSDLEIRFSYLDWWKPYFELNCKGQLCQPTSLINTLGFIIGLKEFSFVYDISYPVLVEIRDPAAMNYKGYSFRFFLESNLRGNEPMTATYVPLVVEQAAFGTMFCDADKRTTSINLSVLDARTRSPVDEALVSYTCGDETCAIGMTSNGTLSAKMPSCIGGVLRIEKPDYHTAYKQFDSTENQSTTIVLEPYREVDFTIKKFKLKRGELDTNIFTQSPTESTMITLERVGTTFEEPFSAFAQVCGGPVQKAKMPCGDPPQDVSKGIRLIPGTYKVKIYTFNYPDPPVRILPQKKCKSIPFKAKECYYVPEETIEFNSTNPFLSAIAEFDWTLTADELNSAKTIEFRTISFALEDIPEAERVIGDLSQMSETGSYALQNKELIMPRVVR